MKKYKIRQIMAGLLILLFAAGIGVGRSSLSYADEVQSDTATAGDAGQDVALSAADGTESDTSADEKAETELNNNLAEVKTTQSSGKKSGRHFSDAQGNVICKSWVVSNGKYYYADEDGEVFSGTILSLSYGQIYTFAEDGSLTGAILSAGGKNYSTSVKDWLRIGKGWVSLSGKWADIKEEKSFQVLRNSNVGYPGGISVLASKVKVDPEKKSEGYRVLSGYGKYTGTPGWVRENGVWYQTGSDWYYPEVVVIEDSLGLVNLDGDTALSKNAPVLDCNISYYRALGDKSEGAGLFRENGEIRFTGKNGQELKETVAKDGAGRLIYLGVSGEMTEAFFVWNSKKCYSGKDGFLKQEEHWITENGEKYYVNQDGTIRRNSTADLGNDIYYLGNDGTPVGGLYMVAGKYLYFEADGRMQQEADWVKYRGEWYYIDESGAAVTGRTKEIKGKRYSFDGSGVMRTGWIKADDMNYYYADTDGAFFVDEDFTVDDVTYHADSEGKIFKGTMFEKAQGYYSDTGYLILVNLATQRTAVFEGSKGNWRLMREMIVSTGAPINPTPKGEYKTTVHTLHFNSYGVRAWYATGFIGGLYLFHSSPYVSGPEPVICTDPRLGVAASHGCVRMALEDAKWMYDTLPLRTKVVIYEEYN